MNYTEIDIIKCTAEGDTETLRKIGVYLDEKLAYLDYVMSRFIDDYGTRLDPDARDELRNFYDVKTKEYASVTRLNRILTAYAKKNATK